MLKRNNVRIAFNLLQKMILEEEKQALSDFPSTNFNNINKKLENSFKFYQKARKNNS